MSTGTPKRAGELLGRSLFHSVQLLGQNRHQHMLVTPSIINQPIDRSAHPRPRREKPTCLVAALRPALLFFSPSLPFPGPAGLEWSGVECERQQVAWKPAGAGKGWEGRRVA